MEWRDQGLIIGTRRHGETSLILEVMTRGHGRHLGLVKGGRGRRTAPLLQPGNEVEISWRARLEEHLGYFSVETTRLRAAELMAASNSLQGLNLVSALLRLMAEREPHDGLLDLALGVLDALGSTDAGAAMVRFELEVLAESGFGLDLASCAATGRSDDLAYVSPRSSRAVSRAAGLPYHDRLLALPAFLLDITQTADTAELEAGFALTGFFLARDLFGPRGQAMPDARTAFLEQLRRDAAPRMPA